MHIKALTQIRFWGVRGSVPSPGPDTVRYGGNTTCVEVRSGNDLVILDAGTGLRRLGQSLMANKADSRRLNLNLLITHTHWDHIQGLPFFAPLYEARWRLRIFGYEGARKSLVAALTGQMESTYFPVPFSRLPGNINIQELDKYDFNLGKFQISALRANHPGVCVGYRLITPEGKIAFFPDTEPRQGGDDREMIEFVRGVDVLILDSQYDSAEYQSHTGWGHGCVADSVRLALQAQVKRLVLFHHDPDHADRKVDALLKQARELVAQAGSKLKVEAAREGHSLKLAAKTGR